MVATVFGAGLEHLAASWYLPSQYGKSGKYAYLCAGLSYLELSSASALPTVDDVARWSYDGCRFVRNTLSGQSIHQLTQANGTLMPSDKGRWAAQISMRSTQQVAWAQDNVITANGLGSYESHLTHTVAHEGAGTDSPLDDRQAIALTGQHQMSVAWDDGLHLSGILTTNFDCIGVPATTSLTCEKSDLKFIGRNKTGQSVQFEAHLLQPIVTGDTPAVQGYTNFASGEYEVVWAQSRARVKFSSVFNSGRREFLATVITPDQKQIVWQQRDLRALFGWL